MMARRTREDEDESLKIEGPFGIGGKVRGPQTTLALLICLAVAGIVTVIYFHDKKMDEHNIRSDEQTAEIVYVLTLPESERKQLNLQMPPSLRKRAHYGRGGYLEESYRPTKEERP